MKSKGITIIEIIVTIALISIVLLFLFTILVDLNQTELSSSTETSDLVNRAVITKTIQDDIKEEIMNESIKECSKTAEELGCYQFTYLNKTAELKIEKNLITYTTFVNGTEDSKESWVLETGFYETPTYEEKTVGSEGILIYSIIKIPVNLDNEPNDNTNLDLEIVWNNVELVLKSGIELNNN